MKKIAIFGDSWACGEWDTPTGQAQSYCETHPGINQYLADHYQVQRFGKGGCSNWDIFKRIHSYLEFTKPLPENRADVILIIQSSLARSSRASEYHVDYKDMYSKHSSYQQLCTELLEIWYIKLQELAERYNLTFYMVGGLADVNTEILKMYDRLTCLVPSWQQLLDPNHELSEVSLLCEPAALELARSNNNTKLTQSIMDCDDRIIHKYLEMMELPTIGPIDFHPNRLGHKILADYIHQQLKN